MVKTIRSTLYTVGNNTTVWHAG